MSLSGNIRAGAAYVEVTAETSKLQRNLTAAQAQLQSFGRSCTTIGKDMLMLSGAMALPLGLAVKSFADYDDQMRLVKAVTKSTGAEFDTLTKVAAKLGRETSFTAKQVADGMTSLGRMGFSPKEIEQSIQPTLDLARATGTELGEAANIAANSMRIFGIEASKMSDVADVLTATANGSAQTLTDLFEALKMAGPQAKAAGENITDTNAAIGILANLGIKGSLAGTALRKSFSQFAKVKVQDQLKAVGVETVDANGNLRKMAEIMADIGRVMATMPSADKIAFAEEIFDIRGSLAGLSLGGNIKDLEDFIAKLQDIDGTARKTAEEMENGLGGSFRKLMSAVEGAMNAIGKALEGTLQPFINKLTGVTLAVIEWIEANKGMVTAFAVTVAGAAALGAVLITIGVAAKGAAAGIAVVHSAMKGFTFIQGVCIAQGTALKTSISLIGAAFANYRNLAIPALVGTEQLCAAFGLASTTANRTAASIVLMSKAEAAAAAQTILAAKWTAMTTALKSFWQTAIVATVATKAQAAAELVAAAKSVLAAKWLAMSNALKTFRLAAVTATVATKAQTAAELASAAKGAIVAGWVAMSNAIKTFTMTTVLATVATKAHTVAEALCTAGTIALNNARKIAIATTALFTAATLKAALSISAVAVGNFLLAAAAKVAAVAMMALTAVMSAIAAHPVAAALIALGAILAVVVVCMARAGSYTAKLSDEMTKLREKGDELRKTDKLRMERLQQLAAKQKLTNAEMAEARKLARDLQGKYGDLGITISDNASRISALSTVASRLGAVELKVENADDLDKLKRLKDLSLRVNLDAGEQTEATGLIDDLSKKYGSLGVEVDKVSGKITTLNDAATQIKSIQLKVEAPEDIAKLDKLKTLSMKATLTVEEQGDAKSLIEELAARYGDLGVAVDRASGKIARLNSVAASLREISVKVEGAEDADKVARLQNLAAMPKLDASGIAEANTLIDQLKSKYGELGVSVDAASGRIVAMTGAQQQFAAATQMIQAGDDPLKEQHLAQLERLQKLAEQEKLTAAEQTEAQNIVNALNGAYSGLGLGIDTITGKLNMAAGAQQKLNDAMKQASLSELDAEIAEMEANLKELQAEDEALLSYWNHNLWSRISGRQEEAQKKIEANGDRAVAYRQRINAAKKRKQAINEGDENAVTGEEGGTTEENVEAEKQRRRQAGDEAAAAADKVAEIDKKLARERKTELENEIDDINALRDEYKALIQTMLDYEKSKPDGEQDKGKIAELEGKLADADKVAQERIAKTQEKAAEKMKQDVADFQRQFEETEQDIKARRTEAEQDRKIDDTMKTDPEAGKKMLQDMILKYQEAAKLAKEQFQKELEAAQADGKIDDDERRKIGDAQSAYTQAESMLDKYEGKLREAQDGTRKAAEDTKPQGAFLAAALDGLGESTAADRTAKATEAIADNTKKANTLLKKGSGAGTFK